MDILRRTLDQFRDLFQTMSPSQRGTLIVVPVLVLAALGLLMYTNGGGNEEPLLGGKYFRPDELARSQATLQKAGHTDFRVVNQQILVSRRNLDTYTAALAAEGSLPADFSADFDRMQEKIGMFTSNEHRREMMEEARKTKLSKILRQIPYVEDAFVEWDEVKPRGFSHRRPEMTATVSIRPRDGQELSPQQVQSLRNFVAGAVAGVGNEQVVVQNLGTGFVYAATKDGDPNYDRVVALTRQRTEEYQSRIVRQLSHIPNVLVTVNVELESLSLSEEWQQQIDTKPFQVESNSTSRSIQSTQRPSRTEPGVRPNAPPPQSVQFARGNERTETVEETRDNSRNIPSFTTTRKAYEGLQPKSVQVAVSIPDDYYREVGLAEGLTEGTSEADKQAFKAEVVKIRERINADVSRQVQTLIPPGSTTDAVVVSSYTRLGRNAPRASPALTETAGEFFSKWGGALGLGLFALWALYMLNRSLAKLPNEPPPQETTARTGDPDDQDDDDEDQPKAPPTKRDELQTLVKDNPEMAAAVLSRWISPK